MSRLDLVVGPNGAGKTTFVEHVLLRERPGLPFVNADVIAAQRWPAQAEARSLEAARIASRTRDALIAARLDFATETVFSHPSKVTLIEQATAAGYAVHLHVLLVPLSLSAARAQRRAAAGGHTVPPGKVASRYPRIWPLVVEAVPLCAVAMFWDNSSRAGPDLVATYRGGIADLPRRWPAWTPESVQAL